MTPRTHFAGFLNTLEVLLKMADKSTIVNSVTAAVGVAFVSSLAASTTAVADDNPFSTTDLDAGYQLAGKKGEEGKCGEGKCGGDKAKEGACGEKHKDHEGKCGEGKCGGEKAAKGAEGKCGEGKCGGEKGKEGACGEKKGKEGSCGGNA